MQDNSKTTEPVPASIGIDDMGVQNLIMEYNIGADAQEQADSQQ